MLQRRATTTAAGPLLNTLLTLLLMSFLISGHKTVFSLSPNGNPCKYGLAKTFCLEDFFVQNNNNFLLINGY